MSYLYRCTKTYKSGPNKGKRCYQRHSFKRKVEDYVRPKICQHCKNEITYMDKWQRKKNRDRKNLCYCGGPYADGPHRKGSSVWCIEHPTGPTEEDYKERYGE